MERDNGSLRPEGLGSFRAPAGRSIPTCVVAIIAASALAGCTVSAEVPAEPERFKRHVLAVESSVGQARAGIVEDRLTGCLYSFTYADGVRPITLPNDSHAGCRTTTATASSSVGMSEANAPNTDAPTPEGEGR